VTPHFHSPLTTVPKSNLRADPESSESVLDVPAGLLADPDGFLTLGWCTYKPSWMLRVVQPPQLQRLPPRDPDLLRPSSRKRDDLEARFGPSPLYLVLDRQGDMVAYLDRD
jgi:hypothetical protein